MNASLFPLALLMAASTAAAASGIDLSLPPPKLAGGEGFEGEHLPHDDLPPFMRANIQWHIEQNSRRLRAENLLPASPASPRIDNLIWPLRARPGYRDPDYHGISNYVDLNPAFPNQLLDWNCAARTYDMANGYNHAGVDYFLWPFQWRMMDAEVIEIVAVAPGVIVHKQDGHPDRSCNANVAADWNAVYVEHADGTVAWYGHMKTNSTTSKPVGASVAAGEYLGLVGSSGRSSGPHLHLELRSDNLPSAAILEPHAGVCRTGPSLWAVQRPYWHSGINKLATHSAPPDLNVSCPNPGQESPNFANHFRPGIDSLFLSPYYRDQRAGQVSNFRIKYRGVVTTDWSHSSPQDHYAAYWYWSYAPVPATTAHGIWVFEVEYEGQVYLHEYTVGTDIIMATTFGG